MKTEEIQQTKESFENGWDKGVIAGKREAMKNEVTFYTNILWDMITLKRVESLVKERVEKLKKELDKNDERN